MKNNLILKGNKGFTFEFKSNKPGQIAFIRYQEGEREEQKTNYIFLLGRDFQENRLIIHGNLMNYTGANLKLAEKVVNYFVDRDI